MSSTTTQTSIANRALQLLGYKQISSINENSRGAQAILRAYQPVLLKSLRSNFWNFSIQRAILPAAAIQPSFGPANYFPLPPDYLELAAPDQTFNFSFGYSNTTPPTPNTNYIYNDYQIENMPNNGGLAITSSQPAPIYIRYVSTNVTEADFDPSFAEALSCALAIAICEELTNSNTKIATVEGLYKDIMSEARKRNAYENKPVRPPIDTYLLVRF